MQPHDDLVSLPARTFVLGEGLDVGVSACTATVWRPSADLERVHVLLARDVDDTATIAIDLDLLTDGMSACVDRGPVTVWPCWDDDVVCIGLRGSLRAVVELPRPALALFLADVTALVQTFRRANHEDRPPRHRSRFGGGRVPGVGLRQRLVQRPDADTQCRRYRSPSRSATVARPSGSTRVSIR